MAITLIDHGNATTNGAASVNSATFTPAKQYLVIACSWWDIGGGHTAAVTDTFGDTGGGTWTQILDINHNFSPDTVHYAGYYRLLGTGAGSGHVTFTSNSGTNADINLSTMELDGAPTPNPVRSGQTVTSDTSTPNVTNTLPAPVDPAGLVVTGYIDVGQNTQDTPEQTGYTLFGTLNMGGDGAACYYKNGSADQATQFGFAQPNFESATPNLGFAFEIAPPSVVNVGRVLQPPRTHPLWRRHQRRADRMRLDFGAGLITQQISDSDSATATDAGESIAATVADTETGAGTDAGESIAASPADTETATGTDAGESIAATLTDTDTGTGTDAGETVLAIVPISDSDSATAVDAGESIGATLSDTDSAAGQDAGEAIAATASDTETATGVDAGEAIAATLSSTETGTGTDAGESVAANVSSPETATATDAGESVAASVTDVDTGTATDAGESVDMGGTPITDADTATATDGGESIVVQVTDSDSATAVDAEVSIPGVFPPVSVGGTFRQYRTRLEPEVLEQLADEDVEALILILALA